MTTLQQAIDHHRAGRVGEAENAYRAVIGAEPGHPQAHHNLGVLMVQAGQIGGGLAHLKRAFASNPREALFRSSYVRGLLAAGDDAAAAGRIEAAIRDYRDALAIDSRCADAHQHLASVLSGNGRVAEGFAHYMLRAALVHGQGSVPPSGQPDPPHKVLHDRAQRAWLAGRQAADTASAAADIFHLADGSRLDGPAVNAANATPELLQQWWRSSPQAVVIDDFLTTPALLKLRAYCAGSTVWKKIYPAGYLGAAPEDGFACPLLAQIVEETQSSYQSILNDARFQYLGAFKYDSESCAGTNAHGDNALVNVNLYITPDEANLDPEHGGMQIWDRAAADIGELRRYNGNETALRDLLQRSGARALVIPHRANRAVIFRSTLFHKTDSFTFRNDYLSRRINVSMLFGRFG